MGNTDSIPGVSQLKSGIQLISGDPHAAWETQENFAHFMVGGLVSLSPPLRLFAYGTGNEYLDESQHYFEKGLEEVIDSIPVVGHIDGVRHFVSGDTEGGKRIMIGATRTTAVMIGGALGLFGGPMGAVAGGIAAGILFDAGWSIEDKYYNEDGGGSYHGIFDMIDRAATGELKAGDAFDAAMAIVFDGLGGKSGAELASTKSFWKSSREQLPPIEVETQVPTIIERSHPTLSDLNDPFQVETLYTESVFDMVAGSEPGERSLRIIELDESGNELQVHNNNHEPTITFPSDESLSNFDLEPEAVSEPWERSSRIIELDESGNELQVHNNNHEPTITFLSDESLSNSDLEFVRNLDSSFSSNDFDGSSISSSDSHLHRWRSRQVDESVLRHELKDDINPALMTDGKFVRSSTNCYLCMLTDLKELHDMIDMSNLLEFYHTQPETILTTMRLADRADMNLYYKSFSRKTLMEAHFETILEVGEDTKVGLFYFPQEGNPIGHYVILRARKVWNAVAGKDVIEIRGFDPQAAPGKLRIFTKLPESYPMGGHYIDSVSGAKMRLKYAIFGKIDELSIGALEQDPGMITLKEMEAMSERKYLAVSQEDTQVMVEQLKPTRVVNENLQENGFDFSNEMEEIDRIIRNL